MRKAAGPTKKQMEELESMETVRNNISQFGRASLLASTIYKAFGVLKEQSGDTGLYNRLVTAVQNTIKLDEFHPQGNKILHHDNIGHLGPLALNGKATAAKIFRLPRSISHGGTGCIFLPFANSWEGLPAPLITG